MMNKATRFYDTSSLLIAGESIFEKEEKFAVSSITINELENIKTSSNKDLEVKYTARLLLRLFEQYPNKYEIIIHKKEYEDILQDCDLDITNDTKILSDAVVSLAKIFITNDLVLKNIAKEWFDGYIESANEESDNYTGYKEITVDNELLNEFYQDTTINHFHLYVGEYLIIRNESEIVDVRVWTGTDHRYLKFSTFDSIWFGKIKPYNNDIYQKLLFDSLNNNKITMVKGPPGSGKTITSLAFLMHKLERNEIDKIIVFCNTVATMNSAKLGFYPGDKNEKLLDSQIGNLLASKFGGREGVEHLIIEGKLVLLPMSDIRGYDTSGMKAGIYISEAQNLDRTLIKLALQRIGEDCICIIDGDIKSQVDLPCFSGSNNGMRRASKVFRGSSIYGEVTLRNIHRSQISKIAENI